MSHLANIAMAASGMLLGATLVLAAPEAQPAQERPPAAVLRDPAGRPLSTLEAMGHFLLIKRALNELEDAEERVVRARHRYMQLVNGGRRR